MIQRKIKSQIKIHTVHVINFEMDEAPSIWLHTFPFLSNIMSVIEPEMALVTF
jgi:hypothetical protein